MITHTCSSVTHSRPYSNRLIDSTCGRQPLLERSIHVSVALCLYRNQGRAFHHPHEIVFLQARLKINLSLLRSFLFRALCGTGINFLF